MGTKSDWTKYAVVDQNGCVLKWTLDDYKERAWTSGGFDHAASQFGDSWRNKYWHKLTPSMRDAIKRGYSFRKYRLVEVEDER